MRPVGVVSFVAFLLVTAASMPAQASETSIDAARELWFEAQLDNPELVGTTAVGW